MTRYEELAREAVDKALEAYALAQDDPNPYAEAVVTDILAKGDMILLSTARRVVSRLT